MESNYRGMPGCTLIEDRVELLKRLSEDGASERTVRRRETAANDAAIKRQNRKLRRVLGGRP
jgi:hypothetical protein